MHEIVKAENTENELKEKCIQVGEHLYVKSELEVKPITERQRKEIQVVLLMGGGGTRLLHVTRDQFSKHMIDVNGQPLSKYMFDLWRSQGFSDFCFLIDDTKRGKSIREFYKDGKEFGVKNTYSAEHGKLGSGGALKQAIESGVIKSSFINHFPDDQIVGYKKFPLDFASIFVAAMAKGYQAVLVCVPGNFYLYGEVYDEDGRIVDFIEKPFIRKDSHAGIFGINSEAFPLIKSLESNKEVKMERTVFKTIARAGKMFKVLLPTEYWIPVNDDPNLRKFEEIIRGQNRSQK